MTRIERLERLRQKLIARREELRSMISNELSTNDSSGDEVDAAMGTSMAEIGTTLASHHTEEYREIEIALKKFRDGRFGICEMIGSPIPIARLEALPFTRYSVEAQRMIESQGHLGDDFDQDASWARAIDQERSFAERDMSLSEIDID
ncbi:TraR/DksA family transcriptional regulator [Calycomorphotria hydatis]|uniref:General stress protein 16O n=1 Tax=Calycomorphotria hydatis TaxID=2528027 RepID=A0A517TBW6_9PLAN|nr:TraR/DksA family transcriptional regulator [Calycomorphotria hydatis]QDT65868.1 General stress protein 16O [Calycomorphotria hydatis]